MSRRTLAFIPLVALALWPTMVSAQATEPSGRQRDLRRLIIGRWSLNVAKSTFAPTDTVPKSWIRTYAAVGEGIGYADTAVSADGKQETAGWTGAYDNRAHPFPDDTTRTQTVQATDARHASFTVRRSGKVVSTGTRVISTDGKTLTINSRDTGPDGKVTTTVMVFDKLP